MRLHEAQRARAAKKTEMTAKRAELRAFKAQLRQKADELPDDGDLPADDMTQLDTLQAAHDALEAEFDSLDVRVTMLEQLRDDDGADPAADPDPGSEVDALFSGGVRRGSPVHNRGPRLTPHGYGEAQRREDKGFKAARFIIGQVIAKNFGYASAAEQMERVFGDKDVAKALNTAGNATGGALIPQQFVVDIVELLRAESVVREAGPEFVDISAGNLTLPRQTSAATASYQGELDNIQSSQPGYDDLQLNAKKLTGLVPISNDLIRRAALNVEQNVRDDLVRVMALRQDLAFLLSDGTGGSPIGFVNQCLAASKLIVSAFPATDNQTIAGVVQATLNGLESLLEMNMSRMIRPTWFMSPLTRNFLRGIRDGVGSYIYKDEVERGMLLDKPIKRTVQLPTNLNTGTTQAPVNNGAYLFLVDMADVLIGDTLRLQTDVFDQATYVDAGGNLVSAVTKDQTVIRVIDEHDMAIRHFASLAVAILPGWAPAGYGAFGPGASYYVEAPRNDQSAAPSTWGVAAPSGSNNPGNIAANVPGGTQPGRI